MCIQSDHLEIKRLYTLFADRNGAFEAVNFGAYGNQNRQYFQFRLCSSLALGVICDHLTSNGSTNYTPAVMSFAGAPQTITGNFCLGPGDTSCENHTFTTRPAIEIATANGISAAFQAADNAAATYKTFDAATSVSDTIAIAPNVAENYAFVLAGTESDGFRVMKLGIDSRTAGLTNPQATTLDFGAFTTVTDMALSRDGFIAYFICNGMLYYAQIDSDGIFTSELMPLQTTGDASASLNYLALSPAGNAAVAVSTVDAAMYRFRFAYTTDGTPSASVTRIDSTGTTPTRPTRPVISFLPRYENLLQTVMLPSESSVFIGVFDEEMTKISWRFSVNLGAPVNVVSAPITQEEYSYDRMTLSVQRHHTFLVGFNTAPSAEVGTFAAVTVWDDGYRFRVWSATETPVTDGVDALQTL